MIEINLLPEALRKSEGTPLPRFAAMCAGVAVNGLLLVALLNLFLNVQPKAVKEKARLEAEKAKSKAEAEEYDELEAQRDRVLARVDAVKSLYRGRIVWAKILFDLKRIVTADGTMNDANDARRYLWLSSLKYKAGSPVEIEGYASAGTSPEATRIFEDYLRGLGTYKADIAPEAEERKELDRARGELRVLLEKSRGRNPDPENQETKELTERIAAVDKRLAELKEIGPSGGVATAGFIDFFKPGSPNLKSVVLQKGEMKAEKAAAKGEKAQTLESMPNLVQNFKINLELKPSEEEAAAKKPGLPGAK